MNSFLLSLARNNSLFSYLNRSNINNNLSVKSKEKRMFKKKLNTFDLSTLLYNVITRQKLKNKNRRRPVRYRVYKKRVYYSLLDFAKKFKRKLVKLFKIEDIRLNKLRKFFLKKTLYNSKHLTNSMYTFANSWNEWKKYRRYLRIVYKRHKKNKKKFISFYFNFYKNKYTVILNDQLDLANAFIYFSDFEDYLFIKYYLRHRDYQYLKRKSKYSREIKKKIKQLNSVHSIRPIRRVIKKTNHQLLSRFGSVLHFFRNKLNTFKKKRVRRFKFKSTFHIKSKVAYFKQKRKLIQSYIGYTNFILKKYVQKDRLPIFKNSYLDYFHNVTAKQKLDRINIINRRKKKEKIKILSLSKKLAKYNIFVNIHSLNLDIKNLEYAIQPHEKKKFFYVYWNLNSIYLKFIGFIIRDGKRSKAEFLLNESLFLVKELICGNPLFFFIKSIYNGQSIFEFSKQKRQNKTLLIPRITPHKKRINISIRSITKNIKNSELLRRLKKLNKKNKINTSYVLYNLFISHFFLKGEIRKELISNVKDAFKQKHFLRKGISKFNKLSHILSSRLVKFLGVKKLRGYGF